MLSITYTFLFVNTFSKKFIMPRTTEKYHGGIFHKTDGFFTFFIDYFGDKLTVKLKIWHTLIEIKPTRYAQPRDERKNQ